MIELNQIIQGDVLEVLQTLPDNYVNCCVTSPPYWGLRDYGHSEQIGLEKTPELYVEKITAVFNEVKRVLKPDGTLWLNLGDSYAGSGKGGNPDDSMWKGFVGKKEKEDVMKSAKPFKSNNYKPKDLIGIPWMIAFALRTAGWYLRSDIIWHKPNPMPESVTDRPTKSHEYIFLMSKSGKTLLWWHEDGRITYKLPEPDYVWICNKTGKRVTEMPDGWTTRSKLWRRRNLCRGQDYYYDYEAIEEVATGFDGRKDTSYKGGPKDMAGGKHERWKFKQKNTFGNRNGEHDKLHSGKQYERKFTNLQENGQQNHTMHKNRLNPDNEEIYPVRNKRSVWTVPTKPYKEAHFATYPEDLIVDCIKAGCPVGGIVLDPFAGANTTGITARKLGRNYIAIELNPKYVEIGRNREEKELGLLI